jgi:phosphomannomutase
MESSGGATSGKHSVQEKDGLFMDLVLLAAANKALKEDIPLTVSQKIKQIKETIQKIEGLQYSFEEAKQELITKKEKEDLEKNLITEAEIKKRGADRLSKVTSAIKTLYQDGGTIGGFAIDQKKSVEMASALAERNGSKPDGYKFYLTDSKDNTHWVLVRPSGTEPVIRIYTDATGSTTDLATQNKKAISEAIKKQINQAAG